MAQRRRFLAVVFSVAVAVFLPATYIQGALAAGTTSVQDFSQCDNGNPPSTATNCPGGWINGILNAVNSNYAEDDAVPQRLDLVASGATTHTVTIMYQAEKGGVHAYDSLATWNFTQTTADRCQGLDPTCDGTLTDTATTFPIPADPTSEPPCSSPCTDPTTSAHQLSGQVMTMYGGTITAVSVPTHSGGNNDTASVTITYTVPSTAATDVQLLFAGHVAPSFGPRGWGSGNGAGSISGGPYHISLTAADGGSVGGRDNQIQSGAVIPPALAITKTADAVSVNAGSQVGFQITVSNPSTAGVARNVVVTDTLPNNPGLSWSLTPANTPTGCSISSANPQVLTCTFATFQPGTSTVIHVVSPTTGSTCGAVQNSASVSADNNNLVQTPLVTTTVNCASVSITKTADASPVNAGDTIGFTLTVANSGAGTAHGVTITDTLPTTAGTSWTVDGGTAAATCSITAGLLTCNVGDLASQASATVHITSPTSAASCGQVNNTGDVTTGNDGSGNSSASITVNCPSVAITKTPDASPVNAGDTIGFTLSVTNSGAGLAHGVTITDTLPTTAGTSWSVNGGTAAATCSITAGLLTCNVGNLASGASATVHITSPTTSLSCGTVNNTGVVTLSNGTGNQSTASITVNCATIHITKTADASPVNAGDTIGFTLTVSNSGAGTAHGVTVTDTLPTTAGTSWTVNGGTAAATCSITAGLLTCNVGDLASQASATVHITSSTTPASCGTVNNTGHVTTSNDGSDQSSASITVNCPSVHITKTADASPVNAGDTIGFTLSVTNSGAGLAHGVTITDTLPTTAGTSWTVNGGTTAATCSITAGLLTCNVGDLASMASATVHLTSSTTPASCGMVNNTGAVTLTNGTGNQSSASVTVNCPSVTITKTADASPVNAGDTIGFTLTVTNGGAGLAHGVTITDTLPTTPGTSWTVNGGTAAATCSTTAGLLTCSVGDLASMASATVHITSPTVPASCGEVDNTGAVTLTNGTGNQSSASITVNCPSVHITKTADASPVNAGDTIGFTLTVSNSGAGLAHGVTITDTLPTTPGTGWTVDGGTAAATCSIAAGLLTCNVGDLASMASATVHISSPTTSLSCGVVNNTGDVTASNDGSDQSSASITVNCASISLTKTADASPVNAGDTIGFTLTATNNGAGLAHGVTITDTLPTTPGTSWLVNGGTAAGSCSITAGVLTCSVGDLASMASATVHISSPTTPASCGEVDNTGHVTTSNDGSDHSSASITVNCPSVTITKTADASPVNAGDTIGFTLTATNSGAGLAHGVTITDTLPTTAGTSWSVDGGTASATCSIAAGVLTCNVGDLASMASATVHLTSTTSSASCGQVDNTGAVTLSNGTGNQSSASVTVNCPSVTITKTADASPVNAGDTIGFTLTVSNSGAGLAHGVTITDTLPTTAGTSWTVDGGTASATCSIAAGVLTCTVGDLASGASATVHITSPTTSASCGEVDNTGAVTLSNGTGNQSSASITVNCPSVHITKTADASPVNAGDTIGFTLTATNSGTGLAHGVTITDTLPTTAGTSWSVDGGTAAATCSIAAGVLTCNVGDLASMASATVHISSPTTALSCGRVDNTGSVTASNDGGDQSSASITVNCASVSITKTADAGTVNAGDTIGFTLTVSNSGAGLAHGVTITDTLPVVPGTSWTVDGGTAQATCSTAAGVLTCTIGDLASMASATVHISSPTTSASCGQVNNTAGVNTTNDGSGQSTASITVNCASVTITKSADAGTVNAGDTIGFTLTAANSGAGLAHGVTITDDLPPVAGTSWTVDGGTAAATCSIAANVLTCNVGDLGSMASATVHISSPTTPTSCGVLNNTAGVTTANDGSGQSSASITIDCPSVTITKTADTSPVNAGDTIGFTLTATNSGPGLAHGVTITDTLPTTVGTSWTVDGGTAAATCSITAGLLTCTVGDLASQASTTVHISSPTTPASCGQVDNTGAVSLGNGTGDQSSASITVNCPSVHITKTADASPVDAGTTIGFTLTATNTGTGLAHGVTITDTLPATAGTTWTVDGGTAAATCSIAAGVLTCNVGDLASGASATVHISSPTTSASCGQVDNTGSVTATNDGGDQSSASITVTCPSSITITKTADNDHVDSGDRIGYTITVDNPNSTPVSDVVVTDDLPAKDGLHWYMDPSVTGCAITGVTKHQNLNCTFPTLGAGDSISVHIASTTTDDTCGTVANTVTATDGNGDTASAGPVKIVVSCPEEQEGGGGGVSGGGQSHGGQPTPSPTPAPPTAPVPMPAPTPSTPPKIAPIRALSTAPETGVGLGPAYGLAALLAGLVFLVGVWFGGRHEES